MKLERAHHHLETLKRAVPADPNQGLYDFRLDRVEGLHAVYKCRSRITDPTRLGVILGDVVHNARSALDHLVWQLVLHNECTPHSRTSFPIAIEADWWEQNVAPGGKRRRLSPLEGVSADHVATIEALQPYRLGSTADASTHRLAVLNRLWNTDKHRTAHIGIVQSSSLAAVVRSGDFRGHFLTENDLTQGLNQPLEDGAEVKVLVFFLRGADPQADVAFVCTTEITFGDDRITFPELDAILDEVAGVVERFPVIDPSVE